MPLGDAYQQFMQQRQNRFTLERQAQLQQAQNDRLMKQEMLRTMLAINSPQAQNVASLVKMRNYRMQQDQGLVSMVANMDESKVDDPAMKAGLALAKQQIKANPDSAPVIAKGFWSKFRFEAPKWGVKPVPNADGSEDWVFYGITPGGSVIPATGAPSMKAPSPAATSAGAPDATGDPDDAFLGKHGF